MPLVDITNPKVIAFLIENYEKENLQRLNWIHSHREKLTKAATLQREPTNYVDTDVIAHTMVSGLATIVRDHKTGACNRRKVPIRDCTFIPGIESLQHRHYIVDVGLGDPKEDPRLARPDSDLSIDPVMRPVDKNTETILYKPRPAYGRVQYLEKRSTIWPENKYYFAECSNWKYGWRSKDSKMLHKRDFARCWHLARAMRTRVGPQPDPKHYKSADFPGPSKCGL